MLPHMVRYTAFTHLAADNPLLKHNFYAISSSFFNSEPVQNRFNNKFRASGNGN